MEKIITLYLEQVYVQFENEALFLLMSKSKLLVKFGEKSLYEFVAAWFALLYSMLFGFLKGAQV